MEFMNQLVDRQDFLTRLLTMGIGLDEALKGCLSMPCVQVAAGFLCADFG